MLARGDVSKTRCSLPAFNSITAEARFVDAFSQIQRTYKQVRSHIDIAPATPEPVQLYELAAHTSDYNIYLADNLSLHTGILFERNKKVSFINISSAENVGKENEKVCFWKFQMQ